MSQPHKESSLEQPLEDQLAFRREMGLGHTLRVRLESNDDCSDAEGTPQL
jgi:hypothetical protein